MTILSALAQLYDRMQKDGNAPRAGFSNRSISFAMVLDANGNPLRLADKRSHAGKKPLPRTLSVPAPPKDRRGKKIVPGFLWDPTPYSLGVSVDDQGNLSLTNDSAAPKFAAFREKHHELLAEVQDPALRALSLFLAKWEPEKIESIPGYSPDLLKANTNLVFEYQDDTGSSFIHDRPVVNSLICAGDDTREGICLVSGVRAPIARLHPMFGRISDKQAALVSFNIGSKDERGAASSFGKLQGDNAPVSEFAAFAYGTALSALLEHDSRRNLRIGDMTVVFWAEAPPGAGSRTIEDLMAGAFNPPDDAAELTRLRAAIEDVAGGRPAAPELDPATKVYMLGLAPNAARLSVRFWHPGSFGDFAQHVARFWQLVSIEPAPWRGPPAARSLLYEAARKFWKEDQKRWEIKKETIPPLLGGQLMRAVLTGQRLPRTLLSAVIARIRADGDIGGRRAAICKAVINSHLKSDDDPATARPTTEEEIPVSLDPDNTNQAYRLGRLFAVLERSQAAALPGLNATIKDRYFAAASSTPARVFPLLVKNATHHLALLKKGEKGGLGHWLEKELGTIWLGLEADLPRSLPLEDQGRFIAGYYHQRWTKADRKTADTADDEVLSIEEQDQ